MRTQLNAYILFCEYYHLAPFPFSKRSFLAYLVFLSRSLSCYRSVINYINILKHINRSPGADFCFMHDRDTFLTLRALRRVMSDFVRITHPVTIDMLINCFQLFDWTNSLHVRIHAAFLDAFFSFLRISNLVPYKSSDLGSNKAYFLIRSDVSFSAAATVLRVYRTKTIQFHQCVLEIPLPLIPNSILCPVSALKNYISLVPAPLESPLFMISEGSGIKPFRASHFNRFFKSCVRATGFIPQYFSSRSFRQVGATFALNCGAFSEFIKAQGVWQSDAYLLYLKLSTHKKLDILRSISTRIDLLMFQRSFTASRCSFHPLIAPGGLFYFSSRACFQ